MIVKKGIKNYQRLFQVEGMPYLFSDIFFDNYKKLNCFLIFRDNIWTSYIPKTVVKKTLNEGLKLYGDNKKFNTYKNGFERYKRESQNYFDRILEKNGFNKKGLERFFNYTVKLFNYYSKTEFFYTDRVFEQSKNKPTINKNLKSLEHIKNSGREYLNRIFFGKNSYLSRMLKIVSKQFGISRDYLKRYDIEEIFKLFKDKKLDENLIKERIEAYAMIVDRKKTLKLKGKEAKRTISQFLKVAETDKRQVIGTVANKGRTAGQARVIFSSYDDFDKLRSIMEKMKKGEILVAETTSPELMIACQKAKAIITNQGGLMSHAAIVSREFGIPCIVGTGNATEVIKSGNFLEVDANKGIIKIIKKVK
jgi:phosphoenolpyruvate synthase/pyruvate phosphate dikinase